MTAREPVEAWILDDTGFLKQGNHSVGVQLQYTGSAGKATNGQVGVSLTVATRTEQLPIDFELCLPDSWANAPERTQGMARRSSSGPSSGSSVSTTRLESTQRAMRAGLEKMGFYLASTKA